MAGLATITLIVSAVGIAALFALKSLETSRGSALAPALRDRADEAAMHLKDALHRLHAQATRAVPLAALVGRWLVHEAALGFARAAHWSAAQAHRLADSVSHKHRFERRDEPRSAFLREVAEVKVAARPAFVTAVAPKPAAPAATPEHALAAETAAHAAARIPHREMDIETPPVITRMQEEASASSAKKQRTAPKKKGIARVVVKKAKKPRVEMIA